MALATSVAQAATLTVTSTTDSASPGSGSLRAEIAAATPGDTVVVPASASPYTITLGAIPVANAITIAGAGASMTAIEVSAGSPSGAFHVTSGVPSTSTVEFENLTIKGGAVTASPGGGGILVDSGLLDLSGVTMTGNSVTLAANTDSNDGGGAVYSTGGNITITNSTLNGNSVTDAGGGTTDEALGGAAVYQEGSGSSISISGSTIDSNIVSIGTSKCCDGGAVYQNENEPLTITGSHLDGNQLTVTGSTGCCNGGAAAYNDGDAAASTTISGSTLNGDAVDISDLGTNGCCDGGGALYQDTSSGSVLGITASTLNNDKATVTSFDCCSGGGAISSFVPVTISDSTLNSNTSGVTDGDCCDGGGAINVDADGVSTATDSELFDNTSTVDWTDTNTSGNTGCCNGGGAILDDSEGFAILGSDVSGNTSKVNSNVIESGGGGLFEDSGKPETITNSTFSGNTTNATGAGNGGGSVYFDTPSGDTNLLSFDTIAGNSAPTASGGALFAYGTGNSIKASIIAANTASSGKDCAGLANGANSFTFTSAGYNLEDSPDTCGFTQSTDKVVAASSLGLGPLANNGGTTLTRSLLIGSPAINAVPLASCTDQTSPTPVTITTDQRGVARPQPAGANCDIGAFEFGDSDVSVTGSIAPTTVSVGQHATITLTVKNAGPVPATATAVTLAPSKGVKVISATPGTGSCAGNSCSLGALALGGTVPITVVLEPTAPGKLTVRAAAATTSDDPNAANNSVSFVLNATLKPTLTHVSQSHKTWSEGSKLAHLAAKHKTKAPPVGTTFSFALNEAAKVTFAFEQGHKTRGTLSFNAKAGKRKLSFDGKLSRSKKLKPGSYTVVLTAKATGLTSKTSKLSFKIAAG
jgi:uncharacterized repeat protein (TIGR01451 family)